MKLADHEHCTGCAACLNACVKDAISMQSDVEGFLQPVIDDKKCISCGACERVCPILIGTKYRPVQIEKQPLCGISKDINVWRASSSGGAFSEICNTLSCKDPAVFGARFSAVDRVEIGCVESLAEIDSLRKSKYVQADIGLQFRKCRDFLRCGRFVIFSGTPCQIAGLRAYLGRDYESLLTVEFICHGVGSPKVFSDCIRAMSKGACKIQEYGFRSKLKWPTSNPHTSVHFKHLLGIRLPPRAVVIDLYNRFFLNQLCLRKSCMENCAFRNSNRYADITLADCRGERELYPWKDNKNWSVVVANTARGHSVVSKLGSHMDLYPYTVELLQRTNPLYYHTTPGNKKRAEFFTRYLSGVGLKRLARELAPDSRDFRVRNFICRCLRYAKRKVTQVV